MNPEERAARKQEREAAESQRIREAGIQKGKGLVAEAGPIPEQTLREVIRPALVEATAEMRAHRSGRKGA